MSARFKPKENHRSTGFLNLFLYVSICSFGDEKILENKGFKLAVYAQLQDLEGGVKG